MDIIRTDYANEVEIRVLYLRNGIKEKDWKLEKVCMRHKDVSVEDRRCSTCKGEVRIHIGDLPEDQWHFEHMSAEDALKCSRSPMDKNKIPRNF